MTTRRPITFKVLCAIARKVIVRRPRFTDCEWKEAIKLIAAKQGWSAPAPEMLTAAMSAVERALDAIGLTRQLPEPLMPEPPPPGETGRELTKAEASAALAKLKIDLVKRGLPTGAL